MLRRLRGPYALLGCLTGIKIAAPLAVVGAIVGEYVAGGRPTGVGSYILRSYAEFYPTEVFAGVVVAGILGMGFFAIAFALAVVAHKFYRVQRLT